MYIIKAASFLLFLSSYITTIGYFAKMKADIKRIDFFISTIRVCKTIIPTLSRIP